MTDDLPDVNHSQRHARGCLFSGLLGAMTLCILLVSVYGIALSFVDLTISRREITNAVLSMQDRLPTIETGLMDDGSIKPQVQAFLDRLETVSQRGLDLNSMQVLFGAFGLAFVSISAYLLQRSQEMVEGIDKQKHDMERQLLQLKYKLLQVQGATSKTETEIKNQEYQTEKLRNDFERVSAQLRKTIRAEEKAVEKLVQLVQGTEDKMCTVRKDLDHLPILAKSLTAGSDLIGLASFARLYLHLFLYSDKDESRLSHLVELRDTLELMGDKLRSPLNGIALEQQTHSLIYDTIDQIRRTSQASTSLSDSDIPERCKNILVALDSLPKMD